MCVVKNSRTRIVLEKSLLSRHEPKTNTVRHFVYALESLQESPANISRDLRKYIIIVNGDLYKKKTFAILHFTTTVNIRMKFSDAAIFVRP